MTPRSVQRLTKPSLFSPKPSDSARMTSLAGAKRHQAFRHQPDFAHLDAQEDHS
jgi:hypothetical protein